MVSLLEDVGSEVEAYRSGNRTMADALAGSAFKVGLSLARTVLDGRSPGTREVHRYLESAGRGALARSRETDRELERSLQLFRERTEKIVRELE